MICLQVLVEPKNALGKQYKKMFKMNDVSCFSFTLVYWGIFSFNQYPLLIQKVESIISVCLAYT